MKLIKCTHSYLSPDVEYFHGHHVAYGTVALLCSVSIVSGLQLLLTLQPVLNRKFNFVKIKPLATGSVLRMLQR